MTEKKKITTTKPKRRRGRPRKKPSAKVTTQCCEHKSRCTLCPCKLIKGLFGYIKSLFS